MKISVVVPCHNTGPWIQQALQSVAAQTRPAHEIIVINDSSTDDTVEQIHSSGVKVRFLDTRLGNAAAARNVGIKSAEGEWIAFLDGDDVWCSDHLERASRACMPHDVACFSQYSRLTDGQPISPSTTSLAIFADDTCGGIPAARLCENRQGIVNGWPTSGMLIRRDRLVRIGGFDESLKRRHDTELFFRAAHDHTFALQFTPTWHYRIRSDGNISSNLVECTAYFLTALKKLEALYESDEMSRLVYHQARVALGAAVRACDREAIETVYNLAENELPLHWRLSKRFWLSFPQAGALLRPKT